MIYLDYAATTPLDPQVQYEIKQFLELGPSNASSVHQYGQKAHHVLSQARAELSQFIHAQEKEIIFTSGGTEANNLAILGYANRLAPSKKFHFITSKIEHSSVLAAFAYLEQQGHDVTYLAPQKDGLISVQKIKESIQQNTALISIMWTNNELGNVNPISEIAELCQTNDIKFHCDAVQTLGHEKINFNDSNIDMLSISAHKIYGLAGVGALIVKSGTSLHPIIKGGNQNWNLRGGTENLLGIHGFKIALQELDRNYTNDFKHNMSLFDYLLSKLKTIPSISINTNIQHHSGHILNISVNKINGELLFMRLDMLGIAISNGAACSSGAQKPSHVMMAMGKSEEEAQSTIRISWGRFSTKNEINLFVKALNDIINSVENNGTK